MGITNRYLLIVVTFLCMSRGERSSFYSLHAMEKDEEDKVEQLVIEANFLSFSKAVRGDPQAQFEQGKHDYQLYLKSEDDKHLASAIGWLDQAANNNHSAARTMLDEIVAEDLKRKESASSLSSSSFFSFPLSDSHIGEIKEQSFPNQWALSFGTDSKTIVLKICSYIDDEEDLVRMAQVNHKWNRWIKSAFPRPRHPALESRKRLFDKIYTGLRLESNHRSDLNKMLTNLAYNFPNLQVEIKDILERLRPPEDLLDKECNEEFLDSKSPTTKHTYFKNINVLIEKLIDLKIDLKKIINLQEKELSLIDVVISEYEDYLNRWINWKDPKNLCSLPKTKLDLRIGHHFYRISEYLARSVNSLDIYGCEYRENTFGNHATRHIGGVHYKNNSHNTSLSPTMELAMNWFYDLMNPGSVSPSIFIRVEDLPYLKPNPDSPFAKNWVIANGRSGIDNLITTYNISNDKLKKSHRSDIVQASETVYGLQLDEFLKKVAWREDTFDCIDTDSFGWHILISLLFNPSDYKPDNLFVQGWEPQEGRKPDTRYKIVGIDNDGCLADPFIYIGDSRKKYLGTKNVLYFFKDLMRKDISPQVRKQFSQIKAPIFLLNWLFHLKQEETYYQEMFNKEGLYTVIDKNQRANGKANYHEDKTFPIRFCPGTIHSLFEGIKHIQGLLENTNQIKTYEDLFKHYDELLFFSYEAYFNKYNVPFEYHNYISYKTPLNLGDYSKFENYLKNNTHNNLPYSYKEYLQYGGPVSYDEYLKFLNADIQKTNPYSSIQLTENHQLGDKFRAYTYLQKFIHTIWKLNYSPYLAASEAIFKKSELDDLEVLSYTSYKDEGAKFEQLKNALEERVKSPDSYALDRTQDLNGCLEELVKSINFMEVHSKIIEIFIQKWCQYLPGHINILKKQLPDDFLFYMIDQKAPASMFSLLINDVKLDINVRGKQGKSVLHHVVNHSKDLHLTVEQLKILITLGADLEAQNQLKGTPLDLVARNNNHALFNELVLLGAGQKASPDNIKKYHTGLLEKAQSLPKNVFDCLFQTNQELVWQLTLNTLLPQNLYGSFIKTISRDSLNVSAQIMEKYFNPKRKIKRRTTHKIAGHDQSLYVTVYPEFPGVELAVSRFIRSLIGYGAPYSELGLLTQYPILLTQIIEGCELNDAIANKPNLIKKLDPYYLSGMLITNMLIHPNDNKTKYKVAPFTNEQKGTSYRIVATKNNHAFKSNFKEDLKSLQVKNILYSLDLMKKPINIKFSDNFKTLNIFKFLEDWLNGLLTYYQNAKKLFSHQGTLKNTIIDVPFIPGMISSLYSKMIFLQQTLDKKIYTTHLKLLKRFNEIDQTFLHKKSLEHNNTQDSQYGPEQALRELQQVHNDSTNYVKALKNLKQGKAEDFKNLEFTEIQEILMNQLDFNNLTFNQCQNFLQSIIGKEFKRLSLVNCHALTDSFLNNLNLSLITKLNLKGCNALTHFSTSKLFAGKVPFVLPNLVSLNLAGCTSLCELKLQAENLLTLNLTGCAYITDEILDDVLKHSLKLKRLELDGCDLIHNHALRLEFPSYPLSFFKNIQQKRRVIEHIEDAQQSKKLHLK